MRKYIHWLPIIVIFLMMIAAYFLGAANYFTYEMLKERHMALETFVKVHYLAASAIFIGTYIVSTALSLPVGIYISLIGGFLFAQPWSTLFVVFGATIGACILFLAAKTALRDLLTQKYTGTLSKMKKGFNENAASYLLFLRLVPIFPFWLVNLASALFGVRFWTFVWTTAVGIVPAAFVFTQFGAGLGAVFEGKKEFSLNNVFNNDVKIALAGLAILVVIPVVVKKIHKRNKNA